MADVQVDKDISWDYESCVMRNYRVQGTCRNAASNSPGGGGFGNCELPCGAANSNNLQQFVTNVAACSVEDVCKKLRDSGLNRRIATIQVFNAPFDVSGSNMSDTAGGDCLKDVTPSAGDCHECCDFLIDEDQEQTITANFSVDTSGFYVLMSGEMEVSDESAVISSNYHHVMSGMMQIFNVFAEDLGTFDADAVASSSVVNLGAVFPPEPAEAADTTVADVDSCCLGTIASILQFKHNLGNILSLKRFLLSNGYSLAGGLDTDSFIPLHYSPLYDSWRNSVYFAGAESWSLDFEFGCTDVWKFTTNIRRRVFSLKDEILRLTVTWNIDTVCPSTFDGFEFSFDFKKMITAPSGTVVFHDEALFLASSPSFNTSPVEFSVSVGNKERRQTFEQNLETQRSATSHVADVSGHPL